MEETPKSYRHSVDLPETGQTLNFTVERGAEDVEISSEFDHEREELLFLFSHLLSEDRIVKSEEKRSLNTTPVRVDERVEIVLLLWERQAIRIKLPCEDWPAQLSHIDRRRARIINEIIRKECIPLTQLDVQERGAFNRLTTGERQAFADFLCDLLEELYPQRHRSENLEPWSEEVRHVVFAALALFGFDVIRLAIPDEQILRQRSLADERLTLVGGAQKQMRSDLLSSLDRLGRHVCEVIRSWQMELLQSTNKERRVRTCNTNTVGRDTRSRSRGLHTSTVRVSKTSHSLATDRYYSKGKLDQFAGKVKEDSLAPAAA